MSDNASISVFTEILKELAAYSEAADTGTATHSEFLELQRLHVRIMDAHNTGYFNRSQYAALNAAYFDIKDNFREVLGLNRY